MGSLREYIKDQYFFPCVVSFDHYISFICEYIINSAHSISQVLVVQELGETLPPPPNTIAGVGRGEALLLGSKTGCSGNQT